MKPPRLPAAVTMYAFVGNLGCVRFPPEIRKASGIKRGDRLTVTRQGNRSVLLEKLPLAIPSDTVRVESCACEAVPEGCSEGPLDLVTVGWSYIQLNATVAEALGFLPGRPVKMVGESSQITVTLHANLSDLEGVPLVACPP